MKKLLTTITLGAAIVPLAATVSCSSAQESKIIDLGKHEIFLDRPTQDASDRTHIILENIQKQDIKKLPANINTYFNSHLVSGGYGEERHYYTGSSALTTTSQNSNFHVGVDVLLPTNRELISPVDGEVIAAFWKDSPVLFYGIGGTVVIRTKIADLNVDDELKEFVYIKKSRTKAEVLKLPKLLFKHNKQLLHMNEDRFFEVGESDYKTYIDSLQQAEKDKLIEETKYIYLTFMHLSRDSLNVFSNNTLELQKEDRRKHIVYNDSIDIKHPHVIKRGQPIGKVGTMADNGGWAPHVHLEAHSALLSFGSKVDRYDFSALPAKTDARYATKVSSLYFAAKPVGTYISASLTSGKEKWDDFATKRGFIDPNNIYKLYDDSTRRVSFNM